MIGTGFYEDDMQQAINDKKDELNREYKEYFVKTIIFTMVLILFLMMISIYFSRILQHKFRKYQYEITKHINEKTKQQNLIAQQSKMAAMGEMIGNIAHQWRQPLSSISTSATGMKLQKEMNILDDKFLLQGLEQINKSVQYLSQTIDDFRNFFKPNKNKSEFKIQDTIEKVINLVYSQFDSNGIKIIKRGENIKINNYENELIQVIINLLNNSRDELVKKDLEEKIVFIDVSLDEKNLLLEIKDNAGGIPEDIIDRVFEPYFTTKYQSQGTGIGLYMSSEIIHKSMNGKIYVKNATFDYNGISYNGALFKILIPIN